MRTLGRIILILLAFIAILIAGQRVWNSFHWNEMAAVLDGRLERAFPSNAYSAVNDQWLEFTLSAQTNALRIRTNGVIKANDNPQPEDEWWYAFEYQLLDADKQVLRDGTYYHRTRLTRYREPDSGRLISRSFLLQPELEPTDGRSMLLHFGTISPTHLRLRPLQQETALDSILFRVYEKIPNQQHQLGYLWQRLNEAKKQRLAYGSVFGADLLIEQEKQNLLLHDWNAAGPLGIEQQHYQQLKLYINRDLDAEHLREQPIPHGLYCNSIVRGMVPIPPGQWKVNLEIINLTDHKVNNSEISVRWYGPGITQRWQSRLSSDSGDYSLAEIFDGGLLEISTPDPLVVRAWGSNGKERVELTPDPMQLRSFIVDEMGSLSVDIDHLPGQSTPFRVDIRSKLEAYEDLIQRSLSYEFLDSNGKQMQTGELSANLGLSNYDRMSSIESDINLSEAARFYIDVPPEITKIRFTAQHELLLTFYNRPPNMVREVRVPEDYEKNNQDPTKQPAWFVLRPRSEYQLRQQFRSILLTLQPRPPETDPRLLAGDYDWTSYQPMGSWRGRHLLIPRNDELPLKDRSLAYVYHELSSEQPTRLTFRSLPGRREIKPSLLFLRDRISPLDVGVMLGEKQHALIQVAGHQGEIRLPLIKSGDTELTIKAAESVRWFINQTESKTSTYLRRLAIKLPVEGLEFVYLKKSSAEEILSGVLYMPSANRHNLHVEITGGPSKTEGFKLDWTFRQRKFGLKPEISQPIPVLDSALKPLVGSQRFFVPLGSDLPAGKYHIRFKTDDAADAYLTLYQLTPGQQEIRSFFRESAYVQNTEM